MIKLTQDHFEEFKKDYEVYGTHIEMDKYRNERIAQDLEPRGTIHVMWQPITDESSIAEYGPNVSRMYYAIVYDDPGIEIGDTVTVFDEEYEVKGVKHYNVFSRVDIKRKKAD